MGINSSQILEVNKICQTLFFKGKVIITLFYRKIAIAWSGTDFNLFLNYSPQMEMFLTDIKELYTILNNMFPQLNFYFIPQNDHHTGTQALQHQLWNNFVLCVMCCCICCSQYGALLKKV